MKKHAYLIVLCLTILLSGQFGGARAQDVVDAGESPDPAESLDRFDLSTPLSTAQGFMKAAELGEYEVAAEFLDLRFLPDDLNELGGATLAEQLYIVISRKVPIDFGALGDVEEGNDGDGLPSYRDALGKIDTLQGEIAIYLQRVPGEDNTRIWKISNSSVAQIPKLYADYGYGSYVEYVRNLVPAGSFLGAEIFKWVISLATGIVALLAWFAFVSLLYRFFIRSKSPATARARTYLSRPIPALIFTITAYTVLLDLGLGVTAQRIAKGGTLLTLVSVWLLFATINLLRDLYDDFLRARNRESGLMLLRPVTSTVKVLVGMVAFVVWLDNLGVNVTALVAGLGVGGLAVALVLQKPLEDIMGAITLYTQQPVSVGQLCTCGDVTGTVEEISLRTTRLRTLGNSVVIIPNALFATASIENLAERHRILHRQTVRLGLETSESILNSVLDSLREMLLTADKVSEDASRVRLIGFGEFSIDIEVFAHIGTTDWAEFLAIAEAINLGTVAALESVGAKFAIPPR